MFQIRHRAADFQNFIKIFLILLQAENIIAFFLNDNFASFSLTVQSICRYYFSFHFEIRQHFPKNRYLIFFLSERYSALRQVRCDYLTSFPSIIDKILLKVGFDGILSIPKFYLRNSFLLCANCTIWYSSSNPLITAHIIITNISSSLCFTYPWWRVSWIPIKISCIFSHPLGNFTGIFFFQLKKIYETYVARWWKLLTKEIDGVYN